MFEESLFKGYCRKVGLVNYDWLSHRKKGHYRPGCRRQVTLQAVINKHFHYHRTSQTSTPHKPGTPSPLVPIREGSLRQRCFLREHCPEEVHQTTGLMIVTNSSAFSCLIHLFLMQLRRLQSICYLQSMSSIKENEEQFLGVRLILLILHQFHTSLLFSPTTQGHCR